MGIRTRIRNILCKPLYKILISKSNNSFLRGYYDCANKYNCVYTIALLKRKYGNQLATIDRDLYSKLNSADRDLLIRFIIKRYFYVDTYTSNELERIEEAFVKVKELYEKQAGEMLEIDFRGKKLFYPKKQKEYHESSELENELMKYYDVAHAFYLVEYEMDGFNPKNGETILDCGAARGDTLLMFKTMYPDSTVFSFEMNAENLEDIDKVISKNRLSKVTVDNSFLYKKSGKILVDKNTYSVLNFENADAISLDGLAIDDWVEREAIDDIGLIKFDIEGGELNALLGAEKTIKRFRPLLYIPIYHLETDLYETPQFLRSLGLEMEYRLKWTEKRVWGMDCVLFVRFV